MLKALFTWFFGRKEPVVRFGYIMGPNLKHKFGHAGSVPFYEEKTDQEYVDILEREYGGVIERYMIHRRS